MPAVIAKRRAGDVLRQHALLDAGGDRRGRVHDHVGSARRHGLIAFRTAAIDGQFGLDAFLLEQLLAQRGLGDDGRIISLGRQPDAHDLALRARGPDRRGGQSRDAKPEYAAARGRTIVRHENCHGVLPNVSPKSALSFFSAAARRTSTRVDTLSDHIGAAR
jgi:hypothetical protein